MSGLFINGAHNQSMDAFVAALPSLIGPDDCERRHG